MAIRRFFTDALVVRKLKTVGGTTYRKRFRSTATVEGHVQRMDPERAHVGGFVTERTYIGWVPIDLDFTPEKGDQITDGQNRIFEVKEVTKWDFGINQHYQLIMSRYNPEDED